MARLALEDTDRASRLDAAVAAAGWRELRVAAEGDEPLASGVEVAIVAEELGRRLADTPFLGPTLAAELRRLAGAPAAPGPETVALTSDLVLQVGQLESQLGRGPFGFFFEFGALVGRQGAADRHAQRPL